MIQSWMWLTEEFVAPIGDEDGKEGDRVEYGDTWAIHEDREEYRQELGVSVIQLELWPSVNLFIVFLQ